MCRSRKLKLDKNYKTSPLNDGDEIYLNGIFRFNISRILEGISSGELDVEKERIKPKEWFNTHYRGSVNEDHLPNVIVSQRLCEVFDLDSLLCTGYSS